MDWCRHLALFHTLSLCGPRGAKLPPPPRLCLHDLPPRPPAVLGVTLLPSVPFDRVVVVVESVSLGATRAAACFDPVLVC